MRGSRARLLVALAVLLTACGGDDAQEATNGAVLDIVEVGADVADVPDDAPTAEPGEFRPGQDGEALVVGERVRTPVEGYVIVQWLDGVVTHVQSESVYTLVEFDDAPERPVIRTRLDIGRTWHKVQLGATDGFDVETAVGTAAVRGTAFGVNCTGDGCNFAVAEGVVDVTTTLGIEVVLQAGEQVDVTPQGVPAEIQPFTELDDQNAYAVRTDLEAGRTYGDGVEVDQDGASGTITPPPGAADGEGPAGRSEEERGRMDGTYDLEFTIQESTVPDQIGGKDTRPGYIFTPSCEDGPCGGGWDPGDGRPVPFTWTGSGYAAAFVDRESFNYPECNDAGVPSWIEDFVFEITPTKVELIDGKLVVTEFTHGWTTNLERPAAVDETNCHPYPSQVATVSGTGVLRR